MVIPIPFFITSFAPALPARGSSQSYRTPVSDRIKNWVQVVTTTRKSPKRLARKMVQKAARQLRQIIKDDIEYAVQRHDWRYADSFDDRWVDLSVNCNFDHRNEAFDMFGPLMEAYVAKTYGVAVTAFVEILSNEWDPWVTYMWRIRLPEPEAEPKKRFRFWRWR